MLVATVELREVCAGSPKEITIVHVSCIEREIQWYGFIFFSMVVTLVVDATVPLAR